MNSAKMTSTERKAVISLSTIMSLRLIGLFMVLPVFTLYAQQLEGATPALIGVAMGIYGLSQALFQIPFGALSDRFGRKPIILAGLIIFSLGSLLAGCAHSITWMVIGRALQGVGAVGSTILAMMADLTREEQRTKSMAIAGMSIGFSFMLAMLIGPILTTWFSVSGLFYLAMLMGFITIILLYTFVPTPSHLRWHRDTSPALASFHQLFMKPALLRLNIGIFILHTIFTASFVVLPIGIQHYLKMPSQQQWSLYLPTLIIAFVISLFFIGMAERTQRLKPYFIASILMIALAEILLWVAQTHLFLMVLGLGLFFTGFSVLEAFLPSLISRTAPVNQKGSAMGIFSCSQFLGIFVGGVLGGWLYGALSFAGVYFFCFVLSFFWLALSYWMQPPRFLSTQLLRIPVPQHWDMISATLRSMPGIIEMSFIAEEGIAYLKMDRSTAKHPDFLRLKEQLQSE